MYCNSLSQSQKTLKVNSRTRFSFMKFLVIAYQTPDVVTHHSCIPSALVSFLHCKNILMETFPVLFTHITQIWPEKFRVNAGNAALLTFCISYLRTVQLSFPLSLCSYHSYCCLKSYEQHV